MDPNSAYGEGKRVGELLCAIAHQEHGLEATIARCFAFVGPHLPLDAHFAIGNFIRDALRGEPIHIKDGSPCRSYLYAADLAIWLWTILFKGEACHPYNVGSDKAITIGDLAEELVSALGDGHKKLIKASTGATSRYVPSIIHSQKELGLVDWVKRKEALLKTYSWWQLN
jgi:dTDP-glucose 4,6-dehydratase